MLVALETSRELAIIDAGTAVQVRRMDSVGMAPQGVAVSPDGTQAVVANVMQRTLTFLDIRSLMTERDPGSVTVTGRLVKPSAVPTACPPRSCAASSSFTMPATPAWPATTT